MRPGAHSRMRVGDDETTGAAALSDASKSEDAELAVEETAAEPEPEPEPEPDNGYRDAFEPSLADFDDGGESMLVARGVERTSPFQPIGRSRELAIDPGVPGILIRDTQWIDRDKRPPDASMEALRAERSSLLLSNELARRAEELHRSAVEAHSAMDRAADSASVLSHTSSRATAMDPTADDAGGSESTSAGDVASAEDPASASDLGTLSDVLAVASDQIDEWATRLSGRPHLQVDPNPRAHLEQAALARAYLRHDASTASEARFGASTLPQLKMILPPDQYALVEQGWQQLQQDHVREEERLREERSHFRYGEIFFEETGSTVPFLIIPDTEEGRDPSKIVAMMTKHLRKDGRPLPKPRVAWQVRAAGRSYLEWGESVHENEYLADRWGWSSASSKDEAIREFGERLLAVFKSVVSAVIASRGWFLFPAGRRPQHQLIGDAIDQYGRDGELADCVWMQYATLQNPGLRKQRYAMDDDAVAEAEQVAEGESRMARLQEALDTIGLHNFCKAYEIDLAATHEAAAAAAAAARLPGGVYYCDHRCGFTGSHDDVAKHERTCKLAPPQLTAVSSPEQQVTKRIETMTADDGVEPVDPTVGIPTSTTAPRDDNVDSDGHDDTAVWVRAAVVSAAAAKLQKEVDHNAFVRELVESSVVVRNDRAATPSVNTRVHYPTEAVVVDGNLPVPMYPTLAHIQGPLTDPEGHQANLPADQVESKGKRTSTRKSKIEVSEWLRKKCAAIDDETVVLHPRMTHLLLWQAPGTQIREGDSKDPHECLPWSAVDALHAHLSSLGVAEGAIVVNGNLSDFKHTVSLVRKDVLSPVIAVKSVGGASEKVVSVFESRQTIDPSKPPGTAPNRPRDFSDPYPIEAIDPDLREVMFSVDGTDAEDREMIVVDALNPNANQSIHKELAAMTTIHGGTEERQVGFAASERARFERAWSMCLLYSANARGQKTLSDILFFCMLMLAMGLICIIVVKHRLFGDLPPDAAGTANATSLLHQNGDRDGDLPCAQASEVMRQACRSTHVLAAEDDEQTVLLWGAEFKTVDLLQLLLTLLPICFGILFTMQQTFQPMQKCRALDWAACIIQSELYMYRARSLSFSGDWSSSQRGVDGLTNEMGMDGWHDSHDAVEGAAGAVRDRIAKTFVKRVDAASRQIATEMGMQMSSLTYFDEQPRRKKSKRRLPSLAGSVFCCCCSPKGARGPEHHQLEQDEYTTGLEARLFRRYGLPRTFEGEPSPAELGRFETVLDDGFSNLGADEYFMCRSKTGMALMTSRLQAMARRKAVCLSAMYTMMGLSVMMGAMRLDLFITVTQTTLGAIAALLEYQRVEPTIVALNTSIRDLERVLIWWDSLSFVEKRERANTTKLVRVTERSLVAEAAASYAKRPAELGAEAWLGD